MQGPPDNTKNLEIARGETQGEYDWSISGAPDPNTVSPSRVAPPARLGRFEIQDELARGGMGAVYRAWDPRLGRQVAIKRLLRPGVEAQRRRFDTEA